MPFDVAMIPRLFGPTTLRSCSPATARSRRSRSAPSARLGEAGSDDDDVLGARLGEVSDRLDHDLGRNHDHRQIDRRRARRVRITLEPEHLIARRVDRHDLARELVAQVLEDRPADRALAVGRADHGDGVGIKECR